MKYLSIKTYKTIIRVCKENKWALLFWLFYFLIINPFVFAGKVYLSADGLYEKGCYYAILTIIYMLLIYASYEYFAYVNTKPKRERIALYIINLGLAFIAGYFL